MARIRTIKPAFFRHEGLFDAEVETGLPLRVAFAGLWTAADRDGRFVWKPRELKLDALPHDMVDFSRVLDALLTRGHIVKYAMNGVVYGCIPSWHDHQVINNRETASEIPAPTEDSIESTTSTRDARVDDATGTPLKHAQAEGKGREGKGKGKEGAARTPPTPIVSKPEDVTDQTWADWLAHRKKKGATVTDSVVSSAADEAIKAQMTLENFLKLWCFRGSQGLMADWIRPHERGSPPSTTDANAEAARILGFKPPETINA